MVGTFVERVAGQLAAGPDVLLDCDLDGLSSVELVDLVRAVECQRRRLAAVDVRLLAALRDRGVAAEYCRSSVADVLTTELHVSPGEAKARVLAAEDLGPRVTLTGETLEPVLPCVATALAAGEISPAHVAVIGRTLDRLPAEIAFEVTPVAERFLVQAAQHEHPGALERTARLLLTRLDPDGPEPHDRTGRPEFTLMRHASGWSTARGTLDPATTAALGAILDSLAAPAPAHDNTPDPRPAAHRRHDALQEMCRRLLAAGTLPSAGGVATTVVLTGTIADWMDTRRVRTAHGEHIPADQAGGCTDPTCGAEIISIVTSGTGLPLALGRTHRLASPAQRHALAARDQGCSFPGVRREALVDQVEVRDLRRSSVAAVL